MKDAMTTQVLIGSSDVLRFSGDLPTAALLALSLSSGVAYRGDAGARRRACDAPKVFFTRGRSAA